MYYVYSYATLSKQGHYPYLDKILPFFDPPPMHGQFLYTKHGQNQTFF